MSPFCLLPYPTLGLSAYKGSLLILTLEFEQVNLWKDGPMTSPLFDGQLIWKAWGWNELPSSKLLSLAQVHLKRQSRVCFKCIARHQRWGTLLRIGESVLKVGSSISKASVDQVASLRTQFLKTTWKDSQYNGWVKVQNRAVLINGGMVFPHVNQNISKLFLVLRTVSCAWLDAHNHIFVWCKIK